MTGVPFDPDPLAFRPPNGQNKRMEASAVTSSAVAAVNAGSSIAVAVLTQTEHAQAQQIATLFSSIGLGGNISSTA